MDRSFDNALTQLRGLILHAGLLRTQIVVTKNRVGCRGYALREGGLLHVWSTLQETHEAVDELHRLGSQDV